ncbi:uncharacterized protein PRCAT00003924001 [Priceomyces carsonii]|uniref:uncharacterized protein n=1 Tax=Priceomyces carsonii TaxID=28549 RepID=UPI002EDA3191|nr:unnamed protein product [Priceomyces carsonii]
MSIPETPSEKGFFSPQHGYSDLKIKTQKYSDKPTPIFAEQGKVNDFIASHSDKSHKKKYAKSIFNFIVKQMCN